MNSTFDSVCNSSLKDYSLNSPTEDLNLPRKFMQAGSFSQSGLTLVAYCLGTGILTAHFVFYANGALFGIALLTAGASLTGFVAFLVAECSEHY
jgi:hypothetical protein